MKTDGVTASLPDSLKSNAMWFVGLLLDSNNAHARDPRDSLTLVNYNVPGTARGLTVCCE